MRWEHWQAEQEVNKMVDVRETFMDLLKDPLYDEIWGWKPEIKGRKVIELIVNKLTDSPLNDFSTISWQDKTYPITWAWGSTMKGKPTTAHAYWLGDTYSVCGKFDLSERNNAIRGVYKITPDIPYSKDCQKCAKILRSYGFKFPYVP